MKDHEMTCPTCGAIIDLRDLGQVLSHGNWNEASQRHECNPEGKIVAFTGSRRVGDPVEWLRRDPEEVKVPDFIPLNIN